MINERIKKPIKDDICITKGSTPILYFGDYDKASACTISLNPSENEFLDEKTKKILTGKNRRLCSRIELGKDDIEILTDEDVNLVLDKCKNYFKNNPYRKWFNRFETFIRHINYSYYDGTCVHLDLVQWATSPTWDDIPSQIRQIHLKNDFAILEYLLQKNFKYIFLNGKTVVYEFLNRSGITFSENIEFLKNNKGTTREIKIIVGKYRNSKVIGWNLYLQYSMNPDELWDKVKKYL